MKDLIIQKSGIAAYEYMSKYVDWESKSTLVVSTTNVFNILNNPNSCNAIINLSRVNDVRFINKLFECVNSRLSGGDVFVSCLETFTARRNRKPVGKIPVIRNIYFGMEFLFMRVAPKIWGFKKVYFLLTRGRNRLLSKAEVLGRLVSCGFDIEAFQSFNGLMYIVCKKTTTPIFDMKPSYGPLYKMPRIGKNRKTINVYKLRTMHPYAEYLQKYIYENNGSTSGDKADGDFRLTPWGKFFRKVWLDEFPMVINLIKGQIKIVGVRPLSLHKFNMYPIEAQNKRCLYKPGLIPPFYADLPNGFDELVASEMRYLNAYEKKPFRTDLKYFLKAFYNIVFKRARSK